MHSTAPRTSLSWISCTSCGTAPSPPTAAGAGAGARAGARAFPRAAGAGLSCGGPRR
uniref:Uncharacterized protein n=1 Tax=Arundo donax TaxID=35708 RepID=A0A0A9FIV5_ARUDO